MLKWINRARCFLIGHEYEIRTQTRDYSKGQCIRCHDIALFFTPECDDIPSYLFKELMEMHEEPTPSSNDTNYAALRHKE
jgi:hypothetical protein